MSEAIICETTAQFLAMKMSLRDGRYGFEPNPGTPPPIARDDYLSVYMGGTRNLSRDDNHIDEISTLIVAVWRATGQYPRDRWRNIYAENSRGLVDVARQVVKYVSGSYELMEAINDARSAGHIYQLPLQYRSKSAPRAETDEFASVENPPTWMVQRIEFEGMLRVQDIAYYA